jgi:cellulose synthase/poly-beta-1,6-N-acetylglucosamine synthase-like glycosyltransferase
MMTTLYLFFLFGVGLFGLITLYLVILTGAAFFFRKKVDAPERVRKIAVVIPAHDEASGITATIRSIFQSHYPAEAYEILVIADNCTDQTATVAQQAGAKVFVRVDHDRRGKGQALDWFFGKCRDGWQDAEIIALIDADTLVAPDFLTQIAASLSHQEVRIVQGFYGVSNPRENWRTALATAALDVFHHLRPAGRNRLGGSAGLKGNGMAFRREILDHYGWPAHSIVEDLEFSLILLLDEILVHYNPDAVVYGEMASQQQQAGIQRQRWESGRLQIFQKYALVLWRKWLAKPQVCFLDGFLDLVTPPLSLLVLGVVTLLLAALVLFPEKAFLPAWCFAGLTFYVGAGLWLKKAPWRIWLYLAAAPLFILWKIPIHFYLLVKKYGETWHRTPRKTEIQR